ncbi:MAG: AI-2E family transporter, partial [Clostridia bacterium]|nr:AI-2E family transporter [Clostridia bacterium]
LCIFYWSSIAGTINGFIGAISPIIIGAAFAYPLNILLSFYERHFFPKAKNKLITKLRRGVCVALAFLSLLLVVALVIALVVPQLVSCIKLVIDEVPIFYQSVLEKLAQYDIFPKDIINALSSFDWKSQSEKIISVATSGIGSVMGVVVTTVTSVVSGVTSFFLAVIFASYILYNKEKLGSQLVRIRKRYLPEKINKKMEYVSSITDESFHRFIVAQCTEAVILGGLCTIGMLILKLPYAAMIGTVICVTAFVPVVGGLIGGGVGAFLILMESPSKALVFLIFLILLQNFEGDVIYPKVVGSSMGLPSLWVLAAVTVGGTMFGILGMLLGVPVAATIYRLIKNDVANGKSGKKNSTPEKEIIKPQ